MKIQDLLTQAVNQLMDVHIENPRFEAEVLLAHVLHCSRVYFYAHGQDEVPKEKIAEFQSKLKRRCQFEPMAYIFGEKEFMGLTFKVNANVLIPRPDTESLVTGILEEVLPMMTKIKNPKVLDLCTGSGAIGLSLKHYAPNLQVTLGDISKDALLVADENAQTLGIDVKLVQGDLFEHLQDQCFDLIVSNPPYIPSEEVNSLQKDIVNYEPRLALDGGETGFDLYKKIIVESKSILNSGGYLILEAGDRQAQGLENLLKENEYIVGNGFYDLIGIQRGVLGKTTFYK